MSVKGWRTGGDSAGPPAGGAATDPLAAVPPVARFYEWECERLLRGQRRDLRWFRRLAEETGGPVLELACGAGRVAAELARAGWDVVGLDNQPFLVGRASARAQEAGVAGRAAFVEGDMRSFALQTRFALILLPYNTLGYLLTDEEAEACFRCVAAHLRPAGVFAMQVRPFEMGEPASPRAFVARGPYGAGDLAMYESVTVEPRRHLSHYDAEYRLSRPARPVAIFRQRLTLRSYYRTDVEGLLRRAGLRVRGIYGDFDRRVQGPRRSDGVMLIEAVVAAETAGRRTDACPRPTDRRRG